MSISISGFDPENLGRVYLGEPALVGDQERLPEDVLSDREYEIAALAASDKTYKEIAEETGCTVSTVRVHLHNAYGALDIYSKTGLVGYFPFDPGDPRLQGKVLGQLSMRSLEVVEELSRGKTYGIAAAKLSIGESTARTHVHNAANMWTDCQSAVSIIGVACGIRAAYARKITERGGDISELLSKFALSNLVHHEYSIRTILGMLDTLEVEADGELAA